MIAKIRKFLSPVAKEAILNSFPYRLFTRVQLCKPEIRISCELTTRCNLECEMCTRSYLIKKGELSVGDMQRPVIDKVIQEVKKFFDFYKKNVYFVTMGLGEPLLNRNLFEVFSAIKNISPKINIVLVTNGIMLDEAASKKLIDLGVNEVTVSLNVNNAAEYCQRMTLDVYEKVRRNIENLINLRNKSGKRLPGIFVQYLDYDNRQKTFQEDIKQWLKIMKYGDKCYVHPIVNEGGFFAPGCQFGSVKQNYPCVSPLRRISIKINGDFFPCDPCFYSGNNKIPSLYLGNIMAESPFEQFMQKDSKQAKIIKSMRRGDYSQISECGKCNTYKLCSNCFFKLPGSLRIKGYKWL